MTTSTIASARPTIFPILAVNFVGALGFSIVLPFMVFLVTRLGGNAVIYGFMGATYSVFQLIGAPILGRWSDRVGRKKILLLSQLGTLASWGIFLVALALPVRSLAQVDSTYLGAFTLTVPLAVLFIARALDGLTGGNVSVANAYLADITSDADRSADFGRMAMAANLGYIVGPALAAVLGAIASGEVLPVLAAFLVSAVATLVIILTLHDPDPCSLDKHPEQRGAWHGSWDRSIYTCTRMPKGTHAYRSHNGRGRSRASKCRKRGTSRPPHPRPCASIPSAARNARRRLC